MRIKIGMKYKFLAVVFMCIVTFSCGFMLSACGDKYSNVSITVETTSVELKIPNSGVQVTPPAEDDPNGGEEVSPSLGEPEPPQTPSEPVYPVTFDFTATLNGADGGMSRKFDFVFGDPSIASASIVGVNGDTSLIRVSAQTAGKTTMRVISSERGTIVSEAIEITVYRDADKIMFNPYKSPAVSVGQTLDLTTADLIDFYVDGEKSKVYPNIPTYSLLTPGHALWESRYGDTVPNGVVINENVLEVFGGADKGIVQLLATMGNGLCVPVYVMVYEDIDPKTSLALKQNGSVVETVKSIINPIEVGANEVVLEPVLDPLVTQDFEFSLVSKNMDILLIGSPNASRVYHASVVNSGTTTLELRAKLVDTVSGKVYREFVREYPVVINRIVTQVLLSSDKNASSSSQIEMDIQDVYFNDVLGERVHVDVFPKNEAHSMAISNTDVVLAVTEINGEINNYTDIIEFSDIVVYVDEAKYVWGTPVRANSDIYVALGEYTMVQSGFTLEFRANTFDPSLPVAKNSVHFNVQAGVTQINTSHANMQLAVGQSQNFTLTYVTTLGSNQGSPKFTFNSQGQDIYEISEVVDVPYEYTVKAKKEGDISILITAESGRTQTISLRARVPLTEFSVKLPENAKNVVEVVNKQVDPLASVVKRGVESFTMAVGTSLELSYVVGPEKISSLSFATTRVLATDADGVFVRVADKFDSNGKLKIQAIQQTEVDMQIVIMIYYNYYKVEGEELVLVEDEVDQIFVSVYKPISELYWSGYDEAQTHIDAVIYNANRLGVVDRDKATVYLTLKYDATATYFARGNKIEWFSSDLTRIRMVEGSEISNAEVSITAFLPAVDTASNYTVEITARVQEFNVVHILRCTIKIINPINVSDIEILNYFDEYNGIRLNDLGIGERSSFELATRVVPQNAFNKTLGYQILKIDEFSEFVVDEDPIITLDPANPNIIRTVAGKSGEAWIRIYPLDAYRDEALNIDSIMHKLVHVVVEDGEANAYSIYSPAEFIAIGNSSLSMTKNYLLMNNIDLSTYKTAFPLGEAFGGEFSGTITSATMPETPKTNFIISGITPSASHVSDENNTYFGLFAKIKSGDIPAISDIDFYFATGGMDMTGVNNTVYAGLLAGKIEGSISNVHVSQSTYRTASIIVSNLTAGHSLYFGAVAGEIVDGAVSDVYADLSLELRSVDKSNNLILGGVFGRFAGYSFGQATSLNSNVKINTNFTYTDIVEEKLLKLATLNNLYSTTLNNLSEFEILALKENILLNTINSEAIGGLVGIADVSSKGVARIMGMQVNGEINAKSTVNVGGLIGLNKVVLGGADNYDEPTKLIKNLANMRVRGAGNVGGLVGANYNDIYYSIAEVYDMAGQVDPDVLAWITGLYATGGLVGFSSEESVIKYSYAMSYINEVDEGVADNVGRNIVAYGSETTGTNNYYGDIIGVSAVGGFVGVNAGSIFNSFAYNRIQQINSGIAEIDALARYAGGFAGIMNKEQKTVEYTFAIGSILSLNGNSAQIGEYAGFYTDTSLAMLGQAYSLVNVVQNVMNIYSFFGSYAGNTTVSSSFCLIADDYTPTGSDLVPGLLLKTYSQMRLDIPTIEGNVFTQAGWGFYAIGSDSQKQEWVFFDKDKILGLNKNMPILVDHDGSMLYNQAITEIKLDLFEHKETADQLPTFFPYTLQYEVKPAGLVVLLDNIRTDLNNQKRVNIMNLADSLGLLNITVAPENLAKDKWTLVVTSSDYSIVEVVQPNQSLIGAYFVFKSCGVVTITLRSLLNVNVVVDLELNIVGGFDEFTLKDSKGNDITDENYTLFIKKGRDTGYSIHSTFIQKDDIEYVTSMGLVYTTTETDFVNFSGLSYANNQVFVPANFATILSGQKITDEPITFSVAPYIELKFNGVTYKYVFGDIVSTFKVKVYEGISAVEVFTGKEANMPSGSDVIIKLTVTTDNSQTTVIEDVFSLARDGVEVDFLDSARYAEKLGQTEKAKIASKNPFIFVVDGEEITDRLEIGDKLYKIILGEVVGANFYVEIDNNRYTTREDIEALEDYLLRDCLVNTYKLALKGEDRVITQNTTFDISFNVYDIAGTENDRYTVSDKITFIPASVVNLELSHYTYGAASMEAGEVAGKLLSPGTNGVLKIEISPYYSLFDHVLINSVALDTASGIMLQQLVYRNGEYRYLKDNGGFTAGGDMILRKVTGIDAEGHEYFDGKIYVSTLIPNGTAEGSRYRISVAPAKEGQTSPVFGPIEMNLSATFAPYALLTLDSPYEGNVVARGTVANLRLIGTLQNSTISVASDYFGEEDKLSKCAYDLDGVRTTYMSGERENVDFVIPFYVGLKARPEDGLITVTITIRSRSSLGGELNPMYLTCKLYIVDYIVDSAFTNGTQSGNLQVSVNSYTALNALFVRNVPKIEDFARFIGFDANEALAEVETTHFANELQLLSQKERAKLAELNSMGRGDGGIWWYDGGAGFGQITSSHTYFDFLVIFDESLGQNCYKIRGRDLQTNFPLRLQFETYYLYNATLGCYEFSIETDLKDNYSTVILPDYVRMLTQNFYSDLTEQSDEEHPYPIDSAEAFRTAMVAGGNYMLTADIELFNWVPTDTAIASLDGNGHVISIRSFAVSAARTDYGLFGKVSKTSVLKNLIVDVSHCLYVNLQDINNVNFGFIAGVNEGVIYNCDVVVTKSNSEWRDIYDSTTVVVSQNADEQFGKLEFSKMLDGSDEYAGYRSIASSFIMTSKTVNNVDVVTNIGGLVGKNASTGTITNGRVGRVDTDNALGTTAIASIGGGKYAKQGLNLFSSGNVGGLVGENSGVISNSYFANGYVINSRMESSGVGVARTGGLVANQTASGRIVGSYARGQLEDGKTRASFGGVKAYGSIGGLVHTNAGSILNSYSNMNLTSGQGSIGSGNGVGGFVYRNESSAYIMYSYSLSKVKTQGLINGMFIGVDAEGNLLDSAQAVVSNCFYLIEEGEIVDSNERAIGLVQESWQEPTGAAFEGFAISPDEDGENTWYVDSTRTYLGPQLYLADKVFISSRTTNGEVEGYERGSEINPLLITSLESWKTKIFHYADDLHKSSYITATALNSTREANFTYSKAYIMLLVDIDFDGAIDDITSKTKFMGHLYGNGHTIGGIEFTQSIDQTVPSDFGLFNSLDSAVVTNLNLMIDAGLTSRASHVGVLAGTINDSVLENIVITSTYSTARVTGTNMVGALAGFIKGDSLVYNISSNLAVSAIAAPQEGTVYSYFNPMVGEYASGISYAGAIIGVLDLSEGEEDEDYLSTPRVRNLNVASALRVNNVRHNVMVDLSGEIVGGIVGLVGTHSEIYKAFFDVEDGATDMHIRGRNFTGGLVGENRGTILNSRLSYSDDVQMAKDSDIISTTNPVNLVGYKALFESASDSNAIGGLVGLSLGGGIQYSYNRIPVINANTRVAGGVIGLAINAPKNYTTSSTPDPVLRYLQNINIYGDEYLRTVDGGKEYSINSGAITSADGLEVGALLREVYTTAMVDARIGIGGIVGAQINAPIYTFSQNQVSGANNFDTRDTIFMSKIAGTSGELLYKGAATGYLGLNYAFTPIESDVIAFIRDLKTGVAAQRMFLTKKVGEVSLTPIGNIAGAMPTKDEDYVQTNFIDSATKIEEHDPYANFDENIWNLDREKLAHRFPNLKIGHDSPVKDITNVDEFFTELVETQNNSHYRIINDLVITGQDWMEKLVNVTGRYNLSGENEIKGRLEGAVNIIVDGVNTTRPAKITFRDFDFSAHQPYFRSLFGTTNNFRLSNIDFVFEFDYSVNAQKSSDLKDFAIIALFSNSSVFNNVSITRKRVEADGNGDIYLLSQNDIKANGPDRVEDTTIINMALFVAYSSNTTYNNIKFNGNAKIVDYRTTSSGGVFSYGGLVGNAVRTTAIGGVDMGTTNLEYRSSENYELNIGGLVGKTTGGTITLAGSINKTGNILGEINVTTVGYLPVLLGGVIGNPNGAVVLRNFTSNVDITLNRNNESAMMSAIDYVGGIAGKMFISNIYGATSLGDIYVNSGKGVLYLGGVAGAYDNTHTFSSSYSGYSTKNSTSYGNYYVTGSAYTSIYAGGIYGKTDEQITMNNGYSQPIGDSQSVYSALYSAADITINAESAFIYAGGIIGQTSQGVLVSEEGSEDKTYTEFTTPNNVLRIAGSGFVGDICVTNNQMTDGANYLGGIVGYSNVMLQDSYSNGVISFSTQGNAPAYLGGIVGFVKNHIVGALSISSMNVYRAGQNDGITFVDPIVGETLTTLESEIVILVDNAYYSPELNGIFGKYGYSLSAMEVYSLATAEVVRANMGTWYYRTMEISQDVSLTILIPEVLSGLVDWNQGGPIVPVIANSYDTVFNANIDTTFDHKTVFITNDMSVAPQYFGMELKNIRKIFGNGNSFVIEDYSHVAVEGDMGLFKVLNRNNMLSSLGIKFEEISLTAMGQANIGVVAGVSYGTVFNLSIGGLPGLDPDYMGTEQAKTVADFGNGVRNRYTSSILNSREIATLRVDSSGIDSNVGGMFGVNYGYITNSFASLDITVSGNNTGMQNIGGIAGTSEWAMINNVMNSGRINLSTPAVIGGLVGSAVESYIYGAISNVNMGIFVEDKTTSELGSAFGRFIDGEYVGILVNNDISSTDFIYLDNDLYNLALSTEEMASDTSLAFVIDEANKFDVTLWQRDITKNYGYPVLNTITNISFETGDGSKQNPYQIAETSQLLSLTQASSVYYALTRDMVVSPQNYAVSSQIMLVVTELNGLGHTIVVYGLPEFEPKEGEDEVNIGLFNEISEKTMVINLGVAIVNDITVSGELRINYGSLAVKNYGFISDCYAITNSVENRYGSELEFTNSKPNSQIGGLVSQNYGDIASSWCDVNLAGRDGFFGGIAGSQGMMDIEGEEPETQETPEPQAEKDYKQATIERSYSSGDIRLDNMRVGSKTSAGGIVGRQISTRILKNGYVIKDCYVYGTKFIISTPGYYIGTIIGYNKSIDSLGRNLINTYRTYSYVAVPTIPDEADFRIPTGNYLNLGMVGNQANFADLEDAIDECFDNTSCISVYYLTPKGVVNLYTTKDGSREQAEDGDVATLTTIGGYNTLSGLRGTYSNTGIYTGWNVSGSPWARNETDMNDYVQYLYRVTPLDQQEMLGHKPTANEIFGQE